MILDKYRINPHETLIITDTAGDIKEANDVGVRSIGVIWGVHDEDKLAHTPLVLSRVSFCCERTIRIN